MSNFVITNCGENDIQIGKITTLPAGACFGWYVTEKEPVVISGKSKFFIVHNGLPDLVISEKILSPEFYPVEVSGQSLWYKNGEPVKEPEYVDMIKRIPVKSGVLIIGDTKLEAENRTEEIELSGEIIISVVGD